MKYSVEIKRDDETLDKVIQTAKLHPLMSNVKWVKLLTMLVENWRLIKECKVKLIWEDASVERWLHIGEEMTYNFDYYASAMEAMIVGSPRLGWAAYKEIEWLDFPKVLRSKVGVQDLKAIQYQIEKMGNFQLVALPDNLRLYAYQRP